MKHSISEPVKRLDHDEKIRGEAKYAADYTADSKGRPLLTGRLVRAMIPHGRVKAVILPELPEGYRFIGPDDVPVNLSVYRLGVASGLIPPEKKPSFEESMPVFAGDEIEYAGQPVGMIVGPDAKLVRELAEKCLVEAEELPAVIDFLQAKDEMAVFERSVTDDEHDDSFSAMMDADDFYLYRFRTGRQYHAPMETQAMIAEFDDGGVFIHGSMQCPFFVREAVAFALALPEEHVRVAQDAVGGGFGGKEDFPSLLGPQVAAAAYAMHASVRVVFDRSEDLQFAGKRHPTYSKIRFGVKGGKIIAVDADCIMDAGAYSTSSPDVAQKYLLSFPGAYDIPNIRVKVRLVKTNTPPCGAFRGFGNPQCNFSMDMAMNHLAADLGIDGLEFRRSYLLRQGDRTSAGGTHYDPVPLPEMLEMADRATDCLEKRRAYSGRLQTGRFRRGVGISFAVQGSTFDGAAEWEVLKPAVTLTKSPEGVVEIHSAHVEIGQGVRTVLCKVAAETLGIPLENVFHAYVDTSCTPDSGPSVASRGAVIVGETVRRAAEKLKAEWVDGVGQSVTTVYDALPMSHPFAFDELTMRGDAYSHFLWAVTVVEAEVDTVTGNVRIDNAHAVYNVGTPLDINILRGQMEGGLLQGLAYAACENPVIGETGRMFNTGFADYHVPTALDIPKLSVDFQYEEYEGGPFGAKAAGELPAAGAPAAYLMAVEQALGGPGMYRLKTIPFTAEDVIRTITPGGLCM